MIKARMAITLVAALTLAVVPLAAAAGGGGELRYRDVVTDARRANMPDLALAKWADVLKGSRVVVAHDQTSETIRVKVWARRDFPIPKPVLLRHVRYSAMHLRVYLDIRGDRVPDIYLDFGIGQAGRNKPWSTCDVNENPTGQAFEPRCRISTTDDGALVLRTHEPLRVEKHGRWQIWTSLEWSPKRNHHTRSIAPFDLAPNCAWSCGYRLPGT